MRAFRPNRISSSVAVVLLLLGFLATVQWRTQSATPVQASANQSRDLSTVTIERLEAEQKELKERLAALEKSAAEYENRSAPGKESLQDLQDELARQKLVAGLVPLQGTGVKVVLDDSQRTPPPNADVNNYIIHDYQLRDVVTTLWRAGAEAISLNGERIVGTSSIYCVGSTILVNSTRLSPAYEIVAIGDPARLEQALADDTTLNSIKDQSKSFGVSIAWEQTGNTTVPAFSSGYATKFLAPSQQ